MNKISKACFLAKIEEVLTRGVGQILPGKEDLGQLMQKQKIRLYLGIDPTSPEIHLGHTIPLRKLKQFQDLGHEVILLIGTFTARIGDPSERDKKRKPLTPKQIEKNMATYKKQASKILDFSKVKIKYNGDWLEKLTFADLIKLASHFTVHQLLERDMFQERIKRGGEVWLNEFMYPIMQGYDSVAMNVDLEVGSTDQTFNMLVGRKLQKIYNNKEKFVLTTPMLVGVDGRKMSKIYGNTVNLTDAPREMYFKLMYLRDELIIEYFNLCTDVEIELIMQMAKDIKTSKINPMNFKKQLAYEIVKMYHGEKSAKNAEKSFEKEVQRGEYPGYIPTATGSFSTKKGNKISVIDLLLEVADNLEIPSKSEAKRIIIQGGVGIDGKRYKNPYEQIQIKGGEVVRYGKKNYVRLVLSK